SRYWRENSARVTTYIAATCRGGFRASFPGSRRQIDVAGAAPRRPGTTTIECPRPKQAMAAGALGWEPLDSTLSGPLANRLVDPGQRRLSACYLLLSGLL